jgi:hypothetical protein
MAIIFSFFEKMAKKNLKNFMLSFGFLKKINSQGANTHHKKEIPHSNY